MCIEATREDLGSMLRMACLMQVPAASRRRLPAPIAGSVVSHIDPAQEPTIRFPSRQQHEGRTRKAYNAIRSKYGGLRVAICVTMSPPTMNAT